MGFLGSYGGGIGRGLSEGADNFTRMYLGLKEEERRRKEDEAQRAIQAEMMEMRRAAEAQDAAERARQGRVDQAVGLLYQPKQEALPVPNTATGTPIPGAMGGPTQTVYPKVTLDQIMAVPDMTWKERAPFIRQTGDEELREKYQEQLLERLGLKHQYKTEEQQQSGEIRKEVKATPAGPTRHITTKEGGSSEPSKKQPKEKKDSGTDSAHAYFQRYGTGYDQATLYNSLKKAGYSDAAIKAAWKRYRGL